MGIVIAFSACNNDDDATDLLDNGCEGHTTFTDQRDGQTYNIVQIGNQCWFAENLNYETGNSWCYDNNVANCNTYGRLYDWQTALTACPTGWHLPSDEEWTELTSYLGSNAGGKMKSTTGWESPNKDATNSSGFSGLPGGFRDSDIVQTEIESFEWIGLDVYWWSSSTKVSSTPYPWFRNLNYDNGIVERDWTSLSWNAFSCRCLRD